jgi:DNA ligase (NAD+)
MIKDYLDKLSKAYYKGKPLVSDEEFDRLADLHNYESVGAKDGRTPHAFRMYSLQKVHYGEQEPELDWPIETPKLDGAAISVLYVGIDVLKLEKIITRGDGFEGQDITDKIKHLVPPVIFSSSILVQFNCEVVAPKVIPNARNYASGALNLKDLAEIKKRDLTVIPLDVQGVNFDLYTEKMKFAKMFFERTIFDELSEFPTDGKVIRENVNAVFEQTGYTSKHPRAAYALKPKANGVVTRLVDVEWNTGRTGVVSPVAILEPVLIGEAIIRRATLHNIEYIEALNLEIGCNVEVIRSGEIIPRVVRRVDELQ